jgi:hypothetical protein
VGGASGAGERGRGAWAGGRRTFGQVGAGEGAGEAGLLAERSEPRERVGVGADADCGQVAAAAQQVVARVGAAVFAVALDGARVGVRRAVAGAYGFVQRGGNGGRARVGGRARRVGLAVAPRGRFPLRNHRFGVRARRQQGFDGVRQQRVVRLHVVGAGYLHVVVVVVGGQGPPDRRGDGHGGVEVARGCFWFGSPHLSAVFVCCLENWLRQLN